MATKNTAQMNMDDRVVDNPALLALLESREAAKAGAKAFREKDKAAKAAISELGEEPPFRVGRFIISITNRAARSVAFDVDASSSISIARADE